MATTSIKGVIVNGHGIASGRNANSPYPGGSIALQQPFFKARGLDLASVFNGTLNLSIAPLTFDITKPDFCFESLTWLPGFPAETFSFVRCSLVTGNSIKGCWIYYPHPETKTRDFHNRSVVEVLAPFQPGLHVGSELLLQADDSHVTFSEGFPADS